jgi:GDP-L-fucose synthase
MIDTGWEQASMKDALIAAETGRDVSYLAESLLATDYTPGPLDRTASVFIATNSCMVGTAIHRRFQAAGFSELMARSGAGLDLSDRQAAFEFFGYYRPEVVVLAAESPGDTSAANVLDAALHTGVNRLLSIGSSGLERVEAVRRRYELPWIAATTTDLHGPGEDFSMLSSHILPALIRRYDEAHVRGDPTVVNSGSGHPRADLLHVDDLADACLHLLERFDDPQPAHIGSGVPHTIADIADVVATAIGYSGETRWDIRKPDEVPRKLLDISAVLGTGWRPNYSLIGGIVDTVSWYRSTMPSLRS